MGQREHRESAPHMFAALTRGLPSLRQSAATWMRAGGALSCAPVAAVLGAWRTMAQAPPVLSWRTIPNKEGYMPRAEMITVDHIGQSYLVHSGRDYKRVKVTAQMVAHKFGEFVMTRKIRRPQKKAQQQNKKKKR